MKTKRLSKTKYAVILALLLVIVSNFGYSQSYNYAKTWYMDGYSLDFTNPSPTPAQEPLQNYGPASSPGVANGCYGINNNLLFFVRNFNVYNKNGIPMFQIPSVYNDGNYNFTAVGLGPEIIISQIPNECDKYYIIYNWICYQQPGLVHYNFLFYCKVDMSLNSGLGGLSGSSQIPLDLTGQYNINKYMGMALSKMNGGLRFFYAAWDDQLQKYNVTNTGITLSNTWSLPVKGSFLFGTGKFNTIEMDISPDQSMLALANSRFGDGTADNPDVLIIHLKPTNGDLNTLLGNAGLTSFYIDPTKVYTGVEFSPDNSKLFFGVANQFGVGSLGIKWINISIMTPSPTIISGTSLYGNAQIETAYDAGGLYKLYVAKSSTEMGKIDPVSLTFTPNAITNANAFVVKETQNYYTNNLGNYDFFLLPDQQDGENYDERFSGPISELCCLNANTFNITSFTANTNTAPFTSKTQTWTATSNPFCNTCGGVITVRKEIVIPADYKITITGMTFKFAPRIIGTSVHPGYAGATVIVERSTTTGGADRGGKLILNNTVFTSWDDCGPGMWEGVQVGGWGSSVAQTVTSSTSRQGWFIIQGANSKIENAYYGAVTERYTPYPSQSFLGQTGGIIQGYTGATFRNNQFAVILWIYTNPANPLANRCYFSDCTFKTDKYPLNDGATPFYSFVYNAYTSGAYFLGNDFINTNVSNFTSMATKNGTGIFSVDAKYRVQPRCVDFMCTILDKNKFENLSYGINASSSNPLNPITVDHSTFLNNYRGILLGGVYDATLTSNTFTVLKYPFASAPGDAYGIYLNNCSWYQVEANDFTYSTVPPNMLAGPAASLGIIVSNSGSANNKIYRNTFHDINIGCQAQRVNCLVVYPPPTPNDPVNPQGLKFICNKYFNKMDAFDILEPNGCMDYDQGTYNPVCATCPANNEFSHSHWDYYLNCDLTPDPYTGLPGGVPNILYVHPNGLLYTPTLYTSCKIGLLPNGATPPSCPSELDWCNPLCAKTAIANYQQVVKTLMSKIDGGNTAYLLQQINGNMSPGNLKNLLISNSPYLSDEVLIAAINRANPLAPGILKEIVIANSPLRQTVMDAVNNRVPALPNGIKNQIINAQNGVSPFTTLTRNINEAESNIDLAVDVLIRAYLNDTTIVGGLDSVELALKIYGKTIDHKSKLAAVQVELKNYTDAAATIDTLRQMGAGSLDNFCDLLAIIMRFQQTAENCFALKTDPAFTADSARVLQIASDTTYAGYINAQAILKLVFDITYTEVIDPVENQNNNRLFNNNDAGNYYDVPELNRIFPNPNSGTMQFTYSLDEGQKGSLQIFDLTGRLISQYELPVGLNSLIINEETLKNGVYLYNYIVNGAMINSEKLVIVK